MIIIKTLVIDLDPIDELNEVESNNLVITDLQLELDQEIDDLYLELFVTEDLSEDYNLFDKNQFIRIGQPSISLASDWTSQDSPSNIFLISDGNTNQNCNNSNLIFPEIKIQEGQHGVFYSEIGLNQIILELPNDDNLIWDSNCIDNIVNSCS